MGLISRLLGKPDDYLDRQARSLVDAAKVQATGSYLPLLDRFPVLGDVRREHWDFFVTVAGVFIAVTRLNKLDLPEQREDHLLEIVTQEFNAWDRDAIRAFDDCKQLFDREYDRLNAIGHDSQFLASDALGSWIVWNALGKQPITMEEITLVRGVGAITTYAFFNWWKG
jgi:hypothetical protein